MPVTVQLDLDAGAEATLGALAEVLSGIPGLTTVRQLGDVHHLSMAIYDDPPLERFMPALADLAETLSPIEVQLAHIGLFVGTTSVGSLGVKSVGVDGSGVEGLGACSLGRQPQGVVRRGRDRDAAGAASPGTRGTRRVPRVVLGALSTRSLGAACQPCARRNEWRRAGRDRSVAGAVVTDDGQDRWRSAGAFPACFHAIQTHAGLAITCLQSYDSEVRLQCCNAYVTQLPFTVAFAQQQDRKR